MISPGSVLIPLFRDDVAPRFDRACEALLVSWDALGAEVSRATVILARPSAEEMCRLAERERVTTVVTGGVEDEYYQYLRWKKIDVLDNVMGPAEAALAALKSGSLNAGDVFFERSGHAPDTGGELS